MNELRLFFETLLQHIEKKVTDEVTTLKAKFEEDKQKLITDFSVLENELKAKIEEACSYGEITSTTTTSTTEIVTSSPITNITTETTDTPTI
jgi:uncharacterized protein YicC (UPF0701 family)